MTTATFVIIVLGTIVAAAALAIALAELTFRSDCKSWGGWRWDHYLNNTWLGRLETRWKAWRR